VIDKFDFVVRAENSEGFTTKAFTIIISEKIYEVTIIDDHINSVKTDRAFAIAGETVTLTVTAWPGYELDEIQTVGMTGITLAPSGPNQNLYVFNMPANDVTIDMVFKKTARQLLWETVVPLIENAIFEMTQETANTEASVQNRLLAIINDLIKDTGFTISLNEIIIFNNFEPAIEGDLIKISGTNGYYQFRVSPADVLPSAYNDGIIIASPVGNEVIDGQALTAWMRDGNLYVKGLTPGQPWSVYNLSGVLIYRANANGSEANIPLTERGVYVILSGNKTRKVVY